MIISRLFSEPNNEDKGSLVKKSLMNENEIKKSFFATDIRILCKWFYLSHLFLRLKPASFRLVNPILSENV